MVEVEIYRAWIVHCDDCGDIILDSPCFTRQAAIELKKQHMQENHA